MAWDIQKAEEFCVGVTDGTHDSPKAVEDGRFLITSKHLGEFEIDFSSAKKISEEDYKKIIVRSTVGQWDILFSMIGTIGTIYLEKSEIVEYACKNMGIFQMGGDEEKAYWFYYYLKSPQAKEYIFSHLRGSTQQYLPLGGLREFPIPVPEEATRKKIVGILKSIDNKIENNTRINRNLEEQCFAIFHELFDEEIKEDAYVQFCEYATFKYGTMPKKDKIIDEGYPIFSGYQIVGRYPEKMFDEPQLIIVARGVGGTGDVKYSPANCYLTNLAIAIMVNDKDYEDYLYHYLMCQDMKVLNTGSAQPQITISSLEKYKLYFPEKNKSKDFSRMIKPFIGEMRMMQQENERLNLLRDTLLPKLMSGELDVSDLDI